MPTRIRPTNAIAADAILVGDPGRALMLAQEVLEEPKMSNHARGLWGYSGTSIEGHPLTIQSTGMGGPSAAIVIRDLAVLGMRRAIRLGSCRALSLEIAVGDLLVVDRARGVDGTSRALAAGGPAEAVPDPVLHAALRETGRPCNVVSRDLDLPGAPIPAQAGSTAAGAGRSPDQDADVVDLQTATTLMLARRLELSAATLLVVEWDAAGERADSELIDRAVGQAGRAAARALAQTALKSGPKAKP